MQRRQSCSWSEVPLSKPLRDFLAWKGPRGWKARRQVCEVGEPAFTHSQLNMHVWRRAVVGIAVGQFRDLVESSSRDVPLQETLRKVLNFTSKGWEAAKAHALKAVETDNRMRIWLSDDTHTQGLLFRCHLGRVNIDSPIGDHQAAPSPTPSFAISSPLQS
jgi:hypothetical protein